MSWRKWLVRLLVLTLVAGFIAGVVVYQRVTNPTAVRERVLNRLRDEFIGAAVSLESAQLRLLGGIAVTDLRMSRRDDREQVDFLHVPSAILYHDKEHVFDGRLDIRRIELYRPRLRILRGRDGKVNVSGLMSPTDLDEFMPTVVVHQGTILFEDQRDAPLAPPLELRDANLTVVNDPILTLCFEGSATSALLGKVQLTGRRNRATEQTSVSLTFPDLPVGPDLIQRLSYYCSAVGAHARTLEGRARLQVDLAYDPTSTESLQHNVQFTLHRGKFSHTKLPLALEDIEATLSCVNGVVPEAKVTARSGQTKVFAAVHDLAPGPSDALKDVCRELDLRIDGMPIDGSTFDHLPDALASLQEVRQDFAPSGTADVRFTFRRNSDGSWRKHCLFFPRNGQASFIKFPYPLEQVTGTVEVDFRSDQPDLIKLDLAAKGGGRPIWIKGQLVGQRPSEVSVDIWGDDIPLDDKLAQALPPKYKDLAGEFHPTGLGNFRALIRRQQGHSEFANRIYVSFHDCTVKYDVFPYPLEKVSGVLDILPNTWEFRDFRGTHKGGEFRTAGRAVPIENGDRLEIDVFGKNFVLDNELAAALEPQPELKKTWAVFTPSGKMDFHGKIIKLPAQPPDIDLTVLPLGCRITPAFFPYTLDELRGKVRYARRWVEVDGITARHRASAVTLESGDVYIKPGGGLWAQLRGLQGSPLIPDRDLLRALPPVLAKGCETLKLADPVTLQTKLTIDVPPEEGKGPIIHWDGIAGVENAKLETGVPWEKVTGTVACRGLYDGKQLQGVTGNFLLNEARLFNQPFTNVRSKLVVMPDAPDVLRLPGLRASWFGGEVGGPARVEFGPILRYEMRLTASQVKLEEFGQHNLGTQSDLKGLASAELYLSGQGADVNGLTGSGKIDVPDGKMYNLPLLLDLLKVVGLRPPDKTAFEEARARFDIRGPRVHFNQLNLFGNAISLRGAGEMNLDGTDINLDFHADWARITQILPGGWKKIPSAVSDRLLTIQMRGKIGDVKFTKEAMPGIMDPVKRLIKGAKQEEKGGKPVSATLLPPR